MIYYTFIVFGFGEVAMGDWAFLCWGVKLSVGGLVGIVEWEDWLFVVCVPLVDGFLVRFSFSLTNSIFLPPYLPACLSRVFCRLFESANIRTILLRLWFDVL